jgi:hypothetical protein
MKLFSFGRVALLILIALVVASCGGVRDVGGSSVGEGDHSVTFVNSTGTRICYVFVSPSSEGEWGEDRLGETGVLNAGNQFTVRVTDAGSYDLLAVLETSPNTCDGDGEQIDEYGFEVDGNVTWNVVR